MTVAIIAQTPELVVDFNEGGDDTFDQWNNRSVQYGNSIIVPINSKDLGQEPAIIQNDGMQILKDINPGTESSNPSDFFFYRDELFFVANDGVNGSAIWKTDGTEEGTVLFQDPSTTEFGTPRFFTEAANGWLYYNYNEFIYRTDGLEQEQVFDDYSGFASLVAYQNGIIVLTKNNDDSYSLIQIDDNTAVELAKTQDAGFFADGFGLATVKNGIIFTLFDSDIDGTYLYNESEASLSTLTVDGFIQPSRATIKINDDTALCWFQSQGYYAINGVEGEEVLIHASENFAATQGEAIIHGLYDGNITFVPLNSGWASEEFLLRSDGSSVATNLFSLDNSLLSRMISYGKHGFMADGISNGFDPNLYYINLENGEVETLFDFDDRSLSISSILPLGVVNSHLYFINKLDLDLGAELFRIQIDENITSLLELSDQSEDYKMIHYANSFEIQSGKSSELSLTVFNTAGQIIQTDQVETNKIFEVRLPTGHYVMTFIGSDNSFSKTVFISNE